jgi:hypothetical protein
MIIIEDPKDWAVALERPDSTYFVLTFEAQGFVNL